MLLARAGGGEGFGGGGGDGGGGGGGGGGDGGGDLVFLIFWILLQHPVIGVPVLAIIVVGYVLAQRKGVNAYQGSVIRRGTLAADVTRRQAGLQQLVSDDPQFSAEAFLQRVRLAFIRTQGAWAAQDITPVRPFLSDGVFERFNLQFAEQKALNYRNAMDNVQILACAIEQVEVGAIYQTLAVRITATAEDYSVSLQDGKRLAGLRSNGPFTEIWSFLRRAGAQSKLNARGLIEGNCPNCGAAIELNQHAKCQQCGSLLRSGQYDWVLTEITQDCEWRGERPDRVPGAEGLRERDPGFSVQSLEDTASVVFWRLMAAERVGGIDPVRKVATEDFCSQLEGTLRSQSSRIFHAKCGVGSVRTLGLRPRGGWDDAVMEIAWSGVRYISHADGPTKEIGPNGVSHWLLVLGRQASARTSVDNSMSSAHCPNCGAPQMLGMSNSCEACGTVQNDGKGSWVLTAMYLTASPQGQAILAELREQAAAGPQGMTPISTPGGIGMLAWMVKTAAADGQVGDDEKKMLTDAATGWGIPVDRVESMIAAAQLGQLQVPSPANAEEAKAWLSAIATMALADGKVDPTEWRILHLAGAWCGMSDYDLTALIKQTRARLYDESRTALRQGRRSDQAA